EWPACRSRSRTPTSSTQRIISQGRNDISHVGWAIRAFTPVFDGPWARSAGPTTPNMVGTARMRMPDWKDLGARLCPPHAERARSELDPDRARERHVIGDED